MAKIDLTDLVDAISRLQLNYTSLAEQFYNIFFNPVPMDVSLVFIDKKGEETEVTIPNRAKDQKYIMNGEGSPLSNLVSADIGTIYQDITTGEVYAKYGVDSDNWTLLVSKNHLNSIIMQGYGDPNISGVTASKGVIFVDTQNGFTYIQRGTTGNSNWVRIDSYATSKISEVFTVDHEISSLTLSGACESKDVLSIYEDGLKLNPDLYDMPYNDKKTIILRRPIKLPGPGETTEVVVEYFVDTHVAESEAEQRLVNYVKEARFYAEGISPEGLDLNYIAEVDEIERPEGDTSSKRYLSDIPTTNLHNGDFYYCILEDCYCIWKDTHWEYEYSAHYWRNRTQFIYERASFDISQAEQAIAEAGVNARAQFQDLYDEVYNLVVAMREYIDENYEKFASGVNRVDNYAQQVSKAKTAVEIMLEEIKQLEHNTYEYANYVENNVENMMKKHSDDPEDKGFYEIWDEFLYDSTDGIYPILTGIQNDINSKYNDLTNSINAVNTTLGQRIDNEASERNKSFTKLQGSINFNQSTCENWFASHTDLGDFSNSVGYYKRDTLPIDVNGIYKYSKNIWKVDPAQGIDERGTDINLVAVKDCSYYAVDLGDVMESLTNADTSFNFTITPDMKSIDFSLPDKLDNDGYTREFNDVVCTIRCYIKNESVYTPKIEWDFTKITWLGSEPELEPKKSYIVEFVSYDMMTSWEAHILGICQPSIELDTFTTSFTVNCSALPDTGSTTEVKLVAVIDGRELTIENTYDFSITSGKVTAPLEIERRFLGKQLTEVMLKSVGTPAFQRYYADTTGAGGLPVTLNQNQNYNITCKTTPKTVTYKYFVNVKSEAIETYMRGGLTIEEYNNYPAQQEMEAGGGVTFVNSLPTAGGTGLYVLNSDLFTYYTWYADLQEWKPSARIHPTSPFITTLTVSGKFAFNDGSGGANDVRTKSGVTYYYNPSGTSSSDEERNGAMFEFTSADGIMSDPLAAQRVDYVVNKVKIRYDAYAAGRCLAADDRLPVRISGGSYVNAENDETW